MRPNRFWICGAIAGIGLVIGLIASTQAMEMDYVEIDQLRAAPGRYAGQRVKVAAKVVANTTSVTLDQAGRTELRFEATSDTGATMRVYHRGPKPDAFKDGGVVILEGTYSGGEMNADTLLAKCPSRYEEAGPGGKKSYGAGSHTPPAGKP